MGSPVGNLAGAPGTLATPGATTASSTPAPAATASPASTPYAVRALTATFRLGVGEFGASGSNTITISGLRIIAHIEQVISPVMQSSITAKIYGMTLDHQNSLSRAGLLWGARFNQMLLQAGDSVSGMTTVYNGLIIQAYPKLSNPEDAHFFVQGIPGSIAQLKPVAPTSFPGAVSAATAIQQMATTAGFSFQNNGVTAVLNAPYFPGTAWQQIQSVVKAANCFAYYDDTRNLLTIAPKPPTVMPNNTSPVLISPQTGMIGYPEFQQNQIVATTLFSPQIVATPLSGVRIQSQLAAANNAQIIVTRITHDLASQMPGGPWQTTVTGFPPSSS
jgi:hypothetical protein